MVYFHLTSSYSYAMVLIYFINIYVIYPTIQCDFALKFKSFKKISENNEKLFLLC